MKQITLRALLLVGPFVFGGCDQGQSELPAAGSSAPVTSTAPEPGSKNL